jgi:hypothetical protein
VWRLGQWLTEMADAAAMTPGVLPARAGGLWLLCLCSLGAHTHVLIRRYVCTAAVREEAPRTPKPHRQRPGNPPMPPGPCLLSRRLALNPSTSLSLMPCQGPARDKHTTDS